MGLTYMKTVEPLAVLHRSSEYIQRIGIMGGTFNPPHLGHLMMAEQVKHQLALDAVWFLPSADPPHQDHKETLAAVHREEMVRLAIADNPDFFLERYEVARGGKNYTIDTMQALCDANPNTQFYFIIGADMVAYLPKWHRINELIDKVQFVAVQRVGYPQQSPYPVIWVDVPRIDLSSTEIRLRVALHQSIRYQVPESVRAYILEKGLYAYD